MTKQYILSFLFICPVLTIFCQNTQRNRFEIDVRGPEFYDQSVLSDGLLYKLAIGKSGMYKISYEFLNNTELTLGSGISTLKLYTNRGGLVPESLETNRIDDLIEIPYILSGNNDNSLDPGDFIVFYMEGADAFKIINDEVVYEKNVYDLNNYLFIKQSNSPKISITKRQIDQLPTKEINTYIKSQRYEVDKTNLLGQYTSTQGSGKNWYGDYFNITRERSYTKFFDFKGLVPESELLLKVGFAGRSNSSHKLLLNVNNSASEFTISSVRTDNLESRYASHIDIEKSVSISNSDIDIKIAYPNINNNEGWLDYIEAHTIHNLAFENAPFEFVPNASLSDEEVTISISGSRSQIIWEITDPLNPVQVETIYALNKIKFGSKLDQIRKFIVFNPDEIVNVPGSIVKIENQNLHALDGAELLIVYHYEFEEAAIKLTNYRISKGINAVPVSVDKIFNEFGGGKKDPVAIRDLAKMLYDRSPNFKYLLLVGDGSYDYRHLTPGLEDQNFIPVYETDESLHPIESFPSDDFYALLSNNDGADLKGQLEIAVGRLPVKTIDEAHIVVDKIIRYESDPRTLGNWRLNIGFTADDEDFNTHFNQSERIAKSTESKFPDYNQQKIYFDAFPQVSTSGGARYPDAASKLSENLFNGQLILNYLGHGGPRGWAQERVLKVNDILSWNNYYKLPLLITATCSFTGYDDPDLVSAGEHALLSGKGGAIGLLTTVRAVYSNDNFRLTSAVFDTILTKGNEEGLTIGDILVRSKNQNWQDTTRINARKFALIGDPALKLAIPKYKVYTSSINGKNISEFKDTINALDKVKIEGYISNFNGEILTDFNGNLFPTVYDKHSKLVTLQNDTRSRSSEFEQLNAVIYKGSTKVSNGKFSFEFIVPKDINYRFGPGKISYYAISDNNEDASGHFSSFIIGGAGDDQNLDNQGPEIELFMNNENFLPYGITNNSPILLVKLFDESGINVTGTGIGHDLTAILDNSNQNIFILNQFYESEENDFRQGTAIYPLNNLSPGLHQIRVKAWDVNNNSSEQELYFEVVENNNTIIKNIYNYPNPFSEQTTFTFEHNLVGSNVEVSVDIFSSNGQLIKTLKQEINLSGYRVNGIEWKGENDLGDNLSSGIYFYKISMRTNEGKLYQSSFEKMIIIR